MDAPLTRVVIAVLRRFTRCTPMEIKIISGSPASLNAIEDACYWLAHRGALDVERSSATEAPRYLLINAQVDGRQRRNLQQIRAFQLKRAQRGGVQ